LAEEYESSGSEDDADHDHVDGELEPDWELETLVGSPDREESEEGEEGSAVDDDDAA
jgi:hypothetical protein